jgi:hypothetical protein
MAYWITGSTTTPFDDSLKNSVIQGISSVQEDGIDTRAIDGYRQGIELKSINHFFVSTQPKIWGGTVKYDGEVSHKIDLNVYGQTVLFSEFYSKTFFDDKLRKFESIDYMQEAANYPFPIMFNDGPQQQEENTIEPLTIPFKKNTPEAINYIAKGLHSNIEDGQYDQFFNKGTAMLSNFIEHYKPGKVKAFLEQGEERIGQNFSGSIVVQGNVSTTNYPNEIFDDQNNACFIHEVTNNVDVEMLKSLLALNGYRCSNTILQINHKSATCGFDSYGPKVAKYGTDAISFRNRIRGS